MFLQRSNGTVLDTTINSFWAPKLIVCHPERDAFCLAKDLIALREHSRVLCENAKSRVQRASLPPVMCEGLIGFRHAMNIFFLFDGRTFSIGGVQQLIT